MTTEAAPADTSAKTSEPEAPAPAPEPTPAPAVETETKETTMKDAPANADDSITAQMKNTKSQVSGTWKKLQTSFQTAGKKVSGAFAGVKSKVSSKKSG